MLVVWAGQGTSISCHLPIKGLGPDKPRANCRMSGTYVSRKCLSVVRDPDEYAAAPGSARPPCAVGMPHPGGAAGSQISGMLKSVRAAGSA